MKKQIIALLTMFFSVIMMLTQNIVAHDPLAQAENMSDEDPIAYFYKSIHPNEKVLVVDRGFFPIGASTRNAGFACFGSVTEHMADMEIEEEKYIIDRI
ncbi:MAG: hypothetical protein WD449_03095, partial [Candidatus Babeliales bacterium]